MEVSKTIILPENENEPVAILLYGDIGTNEDTNSTNIVHSIKTLSSRYKKIDIRINSYGGEVYAGLGIFNAIRESRSKITIYIDGVAASMAAVIALCGRPVYMSRFARIMLHSVSGGINGTAKQIRTYANEVERLTKTIVKIVSERTGKPIEYIENEWFDEQDHWFSAEEALNLKLINGIFDMETEEVPTNEELSSDMGIYQFTNRLQDVPTMARKTQAQQLPSADFAKLQSFYNSVKKALNLENEVDTTKIINVINSYVNYGKSGCEQDLSKLIDLDEKKKQNYRKLYFSNRSLYDDMIEEELDNSMRVRELMINNAIRERRCSHPVGLKILEQSLLIPRDVLAMLLTIAPKSIRIKDTLEGKMNFEEYARFYPEKLKDDPDLLKTLIDKAIQEKKERLKLSGLPTENRNLDWYRKNNPRYLEEHPDEYERLIREESSNNI